MKLNKIYQQDCIEGMKELIQQGYSKYFDFIEIDPPYNIGKDVWDKFKSDEAYLNFIQEVIDLSSQLMSDNGTLILNQYYLLLIV
jgi:DNA modification methylase